VAEWATLEAKRRCYGANVEVTAQEGILSDHARVVFFELAALQVVVRHVFESKREKHCVVVRQGSLYDQLLMQNCDLLCAMDDPFLARGRNGCYYQAPEYPTSHQVAVAPCIQTFPP
jgi:hypothetical protein